MENIAAAAKAQKAVDRYNTTRRRIEALRDQLAAMEAKATSQYDAMYAALPDGYSISLSSNEDCGLTGPAE